MSKRSDRYNMDLYQYHKRPGFEQQYARKHKSKRLIEFLREETKKLKLKLIFAIVLVVIGALVYFLYYSSVFKIKNVNITGNVNLQAAEVRQTIEDSLKKNRWLILPQNNYFILNQQLIKKDFQDKYPLGDLKIDQKFPATLNIEVNEKVGQFIWKIQDRLYLMNLDGYLVRELPVKEIVNSNLPEILDLSGSSSSTISFTEQTLPKPMVDLVFNVFNNFKDYSLPGIELASFRLDSPKADFLKLVTKQGYEIHVNNDLSLEEQFGKLKASIEQKKIDLAKVQYINLRIAGQVIYR